MKVIGTELYDKGFEELVFEFLTLLSKESNDNLLISPSDANVLVLARTNKGFKQIVDNYYWNLPDGVPSVWVMKLKGAKAVSRCSGPDFFKQIIHETKDLPVNHYFCGGADGVAKELLLVANSWGNEKIVGTYCPPFKELSERDLLNIAADVNNQGTDILWVGMGAPKQIYFSNQISNFTNVKAIIPIGAAFDFHTGRVSKAPSWIQKMGMEWMYRLLQEPKRLFKRYLNVVPKFIYYNILDR